jgi:hypothetical protein
MFTVRNLVLSRSVSTSSKRKTTQLKQLLSSPQLTFLMEAHSGLSARIVQEAGTDSSFTEPDINKGCSKSKVQTGMARSKCSPVEVFYQLLLSGYKYLFEQ